MNTANVAKLELCKELYNLTGWKHAPWAYELDDMHNLEQVRIVSNSGMQELADWLFEPDFITKRPAAFVQGYDMGFLLRKLGYKWLRLEHAFVMNEPTNRWTCWWLTDSKGGYVEDGDNPEDAICKLAIELAKRHLIKSDTIKP